MDSKIILKYFNFLSNNQKLQFEKLGLIYKEWNEKINLISRKDIFFLYERHILHSLSIAKFINFKPDTEILDFGTGGGFPGIPLAIFFPKCLFHLVDAKRKKIEVVNDIIKKLNLKNVNTSYERVEKINNKYDFIVSRAVAPTKKIYEWSKHLINNKSVNVINNGWILLKGGDLYDELSDFGRPYNEIKLNTFFDDFFFDEKRIIFFQND